MDSVDVILPAAGTSTRMGTTASGIPKQFQKVFGTHLIAYTVDCFHKIPWIRYIVLVVSPSQEAYAFGLVEMYGWSKVRVCPGGHSRHRSIKLGVQALEKESSEDSVLIIHDGARPFVPEDIIERVAIMAQEHGAAGVVRPLVSTVIKPDKKDILESSLIRSDFRNSEMPQAFQYRIIAKAYQLCSDHDLDFGTECLLLALHYSNCPAKLVEGCPDLWKVTYAKDLFTMESVVKEKFTHLLIATKTSHEIPYLENLKVNLKERQIKICGTQDNGANTLVCFLDLPKSSSPSQKPLSLLRSHLGWIQQISNEFKKLSWIKQRLGLYIVVVFVTPSRQKENNHHLLDDCGFNVPLLDAGNDSSISATLTSRNPRKSLTGKESHCHTGLCHSMETDASLHILLQSSLPPPQPQSSLSSHQDKLTSPKCCLPQQHCGLSTTSTTTRQQLHAEQQQSPPQPSLQQQRLLLQENEQALLQQLQQIQIKKRQIEQQPDRNPLYTHMSGGSLSNEQRNLPQLRDDPLTDNLSEWEQSTQTFPTISSHEPEDIAHKQKNDPHYSHSSHKLFPYVEFNRDEKFSNCNVNNPSLNNPSSSILQSGLTETANKQVPYVAVCQDFIREMCQMLHKNSIPDSCITTILNQNECDLTDKLVELVWNRSCVLHGQVLIM